MKLGIIVAMEKEYDLLLHSFKIRNTVGDIVECETMLGDIVLVAKSGIGKVNASIATYKLIEAGARQVISTGCAGGADSSINVGDIVLGDKCCYHDAYCGEPNINGQIQGCKPYFSSDKGMLSLLDDFPFRIGCIASGDKFIATKREVEKIKSFLPSNYNVLAVDMESAAIAQVCASRNIPFLAIRVISDNPIYPNQSKQYKNFWDFISHKSFDILNQLLQRV